MRENRVRSRAALYPSATSLALSCPTPRPAPALLPLEGLAEVRGRTRCGGDEENLPGLHSSSGRLNKRPPPLPGYLHW